MLKGLTKKHTRNIQKPQKTHACAGKLHIQNVRPLKTHMPAHKRRTAELHYLTETLTTHADIVGLWAAESWDQASISDFH